MFAIARMSRTNDAILRVVMDARVMRGNETAAVLTFGTKEDATIAAEGRGPDFFVLPIGDTAEVVAAPKSGFFARIFAGVGGGGN